MSTFDNRRDPTRFAVRAEYPARIAACVAFRSIRYSSTKRACFGVMSKQKARPVRSGVSTSAARVNGKDRVVPTGYYGRGAGASLRRSLERRTPQIRELPPARHPLGLHDLHFVRAHLAEHVHA